MASPALPRTSYVHNRIKPIEDRQTKQTSALEIAKKNLNSQYSQFAKHRGDYLRGDNLTFGLNEKTGRLIVWKKNSYTASKKDVTQKVTNFAKNKKGLAKDLRIIEQCKKNEFRQLLLPSRTEPCAKYENLSSLTPKALLASVEKVKANANKTVEKGSLEKFLTDPIRERYLKYFFWYGDSNGMLRNLFQIPSDFIGTVELIMANSKKIYEKARPIFAAISVIYAKSSPYLSALIALASVASFFTPLGWIHFVIWAASGLYLIQKTWGRAIQGGVNFSNQIRRLILAFIELGRAIGDCFKAENKNIRWEKFLEVVKIFRTKFLTNIINVGEASFWIILGILGFMLEAHSGFHLLGRDVSGLIDLCTIILFGALFVADGIFTVFNCWTDWRKIQRYRNLFETAINNIQGAKDRNAKNKALIDCLRNKILPSCEKLDKNLNGLEAKKKTDEFARQYFRKIKNKTDYLKEDLLGEEITYAIVDGITKGKKYNDIFADIKTKIANSIKLDEYKERFNNQDSLLKSFQSSQEDIKEELKELYGDQIAAIIIKGLQNNFSNDKIKDNIKNLHLDLSELIFKKIDRAENKNLDCGFGGLTCLIGCFAGYASAPFTKDLVWLDLMLDIFWVGVNYQFFAHCDRLDDKNNGHGNQYTKKLTRGFYKAFDMILDDGIKKAAKGTANIYHAIEPNLRSEISNIADSILSA